MKKFEVTETSLRDEKGEHILRIDFMYDDKPGSYCRITGDIGDATYIRYDGHDCVWGVRRGTPGRFGMMFDVPKYKEFVDDMKIVFNIEIPTITYDTDDLVVYYIAPPSKPDKRGIVKIVRQFIFNGIRGAYTQYTTDYKIENIIEYDGLRSVVIEWIEDFGLEFKDDCFPLPKYSDFASQFNGTFDIKLPTTVVSKNTNEVVNNKPIVSKETNNIDIIDDGIEIPISIHKQEEKKSNTDKIIILGTTEERGTYNGYEYFDTITKFMYNGKEGEYIKGLVENLEIYTITYDGFITTTREGDTNPSGDRYILPEYSDFINQIKDTFGVILPTITREYNKIIIFKETTEYEGNNTIVTYKFEFNGKKGTCIRTFNETRNSTQLKFDGTSAEWGFFNSEWDGNTRVYNGPEYKEFRKAANEALGISFY